MILPPMIIAKSGDVRLLARTALRLHLDSQGGTFGLQFGQVLHEAISQGKNAVLHHVSYPEGAWFAVPLVNVQTASFGAHRGGDLREPSWRRPKGNMHTICGKSGDSPFASFVLEGKHVNKLVGDRLAIYFRDRVTHCVGVHSLSGSCKSPRRRPAAGALSSQRTSRNHQPFGVQWKRDLELPLAARVWALLSVIPRSPKWIPRT